MNTHFISYACINTTCAIHSESVVLVVVNAVGETKAKWNIKIDLALEVIYQDITFSDQYSLQSKGSTLLRPTKKIT